MLLGGGGPMVPTIAYFRQFWWVCYFSTVWHTERQMERIGGENPLLEDYAPSMPRRVLEFVMLHLVWKCGRNEKGGGGRCVCVCAFCEVCQILCLHYRQYLVNSLLLLSFLVLSIPWCKRLLLKQSAVVKDQFHTSISPFSGCVTSSMVMKLICNLPPRTTKKVKAIIHSNASVTVCI